jgi:hypothetical protein
MVKLSRLKLTDAIKARIAIVRFGETYVNGGGVGPLTYSDLDLLKVELANELLLELEQQEADRVAQLNDLPRPGPVPVVEVSLHPKRRHA